MKRITVLIVDDIKDTRESIRRLLQFEPHIEIIGEAGNGSDALRLAKELKPDIVLLDVNMPEMDGLRTTELLTLRVPECAVILMSVQGENGYMRRAMMAGAREFLVKPFSGSELASAIVNVRNMEKQKIEARSKQRVAPQKGEGEGEGETSQGKIISFFSTKGGIGKTTLAVNLAAYLGNKGKWRVLLLDFNLQFGDVAVFLNMMPKKTIADLTQAGSLQFDDIRAYLLTHAAGMEVLVAPSRPEYAEYVTPDNINKILTEVRPHYDFIICDNVSGFDEVSLANLDMADQIGLVVTPDIPTLKNIKLSLEVLEGLNYTDKVKLILNRSGDDSGIQLKDIEKSLNMSIACYIPSDYRSLIGALNKGIPFIQKYPQSKATEGIRKMAEVFFDIPADIEQEISTKHGHRYLGNINLGNIKNITKVLGI
jgi:pilus assembly protein CpaE